jgi:tetratricopeptide (TPR) repeat protein
LQLDPDNYLVTWKMANIHLARRQYDQALPLLEKAIRLKPDLGQAHRDLGRLLIQTGDIEGRLAI